MLCHQLTNCAAVRDWPMPYASTAMRVSCQLCVVSVSRGLVITFLSSGRWTKSMRLIPLPTINTGHLLIRQLEL